MSARRHTTLSVFRIALALLACVVVCTLNENRALAEALDEDVVRGCSANVLPPAPRSRPLPNAIKVLPPEDGTYAGLYTIPPEIGAYREFVEKTGQAPPIVFTGQNWVADDEFGKDNPRLDKFTDPLVESEEGLTPLQLAKQLADQGSVMAFAWVVYCCDVTSLALQLGFTDPWDIFNRILNKELDPYIRTVAREVKEFGRPIMMTLVAEHNSQALFMFGKDGIEPITDVDNICNNYGDPAWPDGPERIRDFNMHVIDIFREERVANVTWFMYASANYMSEDPDEDIWLHPKYFYPGDAYIDWVGQSVYFIDPEVDHGIDNARDFRRDLSAGYKAWSEVTQKPIFLPEFGAMSDGSVSRSALIDRVLGTTIREFPRVKAITFAEAPLFAAMFSLPRLAHNADEIAAWRKAVNRNPYFVKKVRVSRPR